MLILSERAADNIYFVLVYGNATALSVRIRDYYIIGYGIDWRRPNWLYILAAAAGIGSAGSS